jgi:hypothetical protein
LKIFCALLCFPTARELSCQPRWLHVIRDATRASDLTGLAAITCMTHSLCIEKKTSTKRPTRFRYSGTGEVEAPKLKLVSCSSNLTRAKYKKFRPTSLCSTYLDLLHHSGHTASVPKQWRYQTHFPRGLATKNKLPIQHTVSSIPTIRSVC